MNANTKLKKDKFNFLTLENASEIKGGKHVVKFCATIELKQCITEEAKYCGTGNAVEVIGPVNPWG
jgi:hypothetical protein